MGHRYSGPLRRGAATLIVLLAGVVAGGPGSAYAGASSDRPIKAIIASQTGRPAAPTHQAIGTTGSSITLYVTCTS